MGPNDPFTTRDHVDDAASLRPAALIVDPSWDFRWFVAGSVFTALYWVLGIGAALAILAGGFLAALFGRIVRHLRSSPPDFGALYKALLGTTRGH